MSLLKPFTSLMQTKQQLTSVKSKNTSGREEEKKKRKKESRKRRRGTKGEKIEKKQ